MAYKENIPQPTDKKNISQADLLNNFTSIKSAFDVNHVTFDITDKGKHQYVTIPNTTVTPATTPPATGATEIMLYAVNQALVFRKENQAIGDVANDIDFTTATLAPLGYCVLPCGLLVNWGTGTILKNTYSVSVEFEKYFKTATVPFASYVSPNSVYKGKALDHVLGVTSSRTHVTVIRDSDHESRDVSFYFLVIGSYGV